MTSLRALWALRWPLIALAMSIALLLADVRLQQALERHYQMLAAQRHAQASSATHGAVTGLAAVTDFLETTHADRPTAEHVAARVLRQCAPIDLPLPASSGSAAQAAAQVADDADRAARTDAERAFALAIAIDLETCAVELERLRQLQRWVIANGGGHE